jgi:hypothetical protein
MKIWIKPEYEVTPRAELYLRDRKMYYKCYALTDKGIACRLRHAKSDKHKETLKRYRFTDKGRAIRARVVENWYNNNPEAKRAHNILNKMILRGKLVRQPCEVCGSVRSHAHHHDYLKPLDVEWLCQLHHKQKHGKERVIQLPK